MNPKLVKSVARLIALYEFDSLTEKDEADELAERIIKRVTLHIASQVRKLAQKEKP